MSEISVGIPSGVGTMWEVIVGSYSQTCILRPPPYKDHILQVPRGILSTLLNL